MARGDLPPITPPAGVSDAQKLKIAAALDQGLLRR